MSERVTADDVRHVETKIIMTEDKMFREKNYYKKLEIREEIIFLRKKLQKIGLKTCISTITPCLLQAIMIFTTNSDMIYSTICISNNLRTGLI